MRRIRELVAGILTRLFSKKADPIRPLLDGGPLRMIPDGGDASARALSAALALAREAFPWTHPVHDVSVEFDHNSVAAKVRVTPNVALRIAAPHDGTALHVKLLDRRTRAAVHEEIAAGHKDLVGCFSALAAEREDMELAEADKFVPAFAPFQCSEHMIDGQDVSFFGTGPLWVNPCGTAVLVGGAWNFPADPTALSERFRRESLVSKGERAVSDPGKGFGE